MNSLIAFLPAHYVSQWCYYNDSRIQIQGLTYSFSEFLHFLQYYEYQKKKIASVLTSIVSVFTNKYRDCLRMYTWHRNLKCLLKLYRILFSWEKLFIKAESISDSPKNLPLKYFPPILEYPPHACRLLIRDTGRPSEVALYARHIDRTNMIAAFVRPEQGGDLPHKGDDGVRGG